MQCVYKKIKKDNGESLAEVLVAILISAVGMLMLSSLIYAATHMIEKGDAKIATIYSGINAMEEKKDGGTTRRLDIVRSSNGQTSTVNIDIYQDEKSGLMSYKKHEGSK